MKKICFIISLLVCLTGFAAENLPSPKAENLVPIDRIVAVVNEDVITQQELNNAIQATIHQLRQQGAALPNHSELQRKVLDGLIYQKLQLQLAKQNDIEISDKQVDQAIEHIAKQNHVTVAQLKQKLKQQNMDLKTFRQQVKKQLLVSTLQHKVLQGKVNLGSDRLSKFKKKYQAEHGKTQYHVIDYLIPLNEEATHKQKKAAKKLALKVASKLAHTNKIEDKSVETNDMGWKTLSELPDLFTKKVKNMQKRSVSQPILAGNGYHVLKLLDTKKVMHDLSDAKARELLFRHETQDALKSWLEKLRKNAYVKIYVH